MFILSIIKVSMKSMRVVLSLTDVQDTVAIHPSDFGVPPEQAIIAELNKKYANRVLHDVGLCICVFDLSEVGEGKVRYGDGCLWYKGTPWRQFTSEKSECHLLLYKSGLQTGRISSLPVGGDIGKGEIIGRGRHTMYSMMALANL
jgi:hypothetical protein